MIQIHYSRVVDPKMPDPLFPNVKQTRKKAEAFSGKRAKSVEFKVWFIGPKEDLMQKIKVRNQEIERYEPAKIIK